MPDHETLRALHALEPLLSHLHDLLREADARGDVLHDAFAVVGEAYAIGHVDGVRNAVAQVAPEAERRGLRLMLAPDVEDGAGQPANG